jgi:CO/xanthine dehydrogenase Mo-binding subunit
MLSTDRVRYKGEPVAAVIAETEAQARDAVGDPGRLGTPAACARRRGGDQARRARRARHLPDNKFVYHGKYDHQKLRYGDVEAAFARADHIVEGRYQMSPIEQAPIETCGAIAAPEQNGRYVCYTSTQALFFSLGTASKVLAMPSSGCISSAARWAAASAARSIRIHEPLAILGAMLTGRPVKYMWDREEEMQVGAPRGAERWYSRTG